MQSCCNRNGWQLQIRLMMMVIFQATIKPSLLTGPSGANFLQYNFITSVVLTVSWFLVYIHHITALRDLQWQVARCWETWKSTALSQQMGSCERQCDAAESRSNNSKTQGSDIRVMVHLILHILCCLWEALTMEATPGLGKATSSRKISAVLQCFDLHGSSSNQHHTLNLTLSDWHPATQSLKGATLKWKHTFSLFLMDFHGWRWSRNKKEIGCLITNIFSEFSELGAGVFFWTWICYDPTLLASVLFTFNAN